MPFASQKQRRYLYANEPEMARRWEAETPKDAELPERAGDRERRARRRALERAQYAGTKTRES